MTPLALGGLLAAGLLTATEVFPMMTPNPSLSKIPDPGNGGTGPIDYGSSQSIDPTDQVSAFLAVIRAGESSDNYRAIVYGGSFSSYDRHPGLLASGKLDPSFLPGKPSHAAGAYQFQPRTWLECARALNLTDFSPGSQDAAAIFLLKRRGAYEAIVNGDIRAACDLLKNEWQMFTLPRWRAEVVQSEFTDYGGKLA